MPQHTVTIRITADWGRVRILKDYASFTIDTSISIPYARCVMHDCRLAWDSIEVFKNAHDENPVDIVTTLETNVSPISIETTHGTNGDVIVTSGSHIVTNNLHKGGENLMIHDLYLD